jgi:hypothetical protein
MSSTLDDLLTGGGAKSAKFDQPGQSVTGTITDVTVRQATEFGTGKPLTWDDGNPREQILVSIQTTQQDDPEDDGVRTVYVKGWGQQLKAFRAASAASGKPSKGDTFTATFTQYGQKPAQGGFPPKEFEYVIGKSDRLDALTGAEPAPTAPPAAAQAPSEDTPAAKAQKLIALGMTNEQIQQVTGLEPALIAAIRGA